MRTIKPFSGQQVSRVVTQELMTPRVDSLKAESRKVDVNSDLLRSFMLAQMECSNLNIAFRTDLVNSYWRDKVVRNPTGALEVSSTSVAVVLRANTSLCSLEGFFFSFSMSSAIAPRVSLSSFVSYARHTPSPTK